MFGTLFWGLMFSVAMIVIGYTVDYLSRWLMEEKLRESKEKVKSQNTSIEGVFSYFINEKHDNIVTVKLLSKDNEVAEVTFNSKSGVAPDLRTGMRNTI